MPVHSAAHTDMLLARTPLGCPNYLVRSPQPSPAPERAGKGLVQIEASIKSKCKVYGRYCATHPNLELILIRVEPQQTCQL
eukprot:7544950-Ditylum_brightwellii.AAC.1